MAGPGYRSDVAHIGKSVIIKGELNGSEDLFFDGKLDGTVDLKGNSLTVGPNGGVRANITAREVIIQGKVDGNIQASDRIELRNSALLNGDVTTARIVIEDGAFFKGSVEIVRSEKPEAKPAAAASNVTPPVPPSMSSSPGASPTGAAIAAGFTSQSGQK